MYIIKNAFANIIRNKGRNILMGIIIFIMLFSSTVAVTIHQSSKKQVENYRSQFSSNIILSRNDNKLPKNIEEYREPNMNDYERFSKSELLASTTLTTSNATALVDGKAIDEGALSSNNLTVDDAMGSSGTSSYKVSTNMLYGTDIASADSFFTGTRKITEGTIFKNDDEAVISKELAQLNNWQIGDQIKLSAMNLDTMKKVTFTVTITGFYEDSADAYDSSDMQGVALGNHRNEIFTSVNTLTSRLGNSGVSAIFTIKDPDQIDALAKDFYEKGLPEYFDVKVDDAQFRKIISPLEGLQSITLLFTLGILIAGGVILFIVSNMAIRERKYEIGVLRAMGMKKRKIALGLLTEMFAITGICLLLSLSFAVLTQEPIADLLYESQPVSEENQAVSGDLSSGLSTVNLEDVEDISFDMDMQTTLIIILIAMVLAGGASTISILYVTKYEPLKILAERK